MAEKKQNIAPRKTNKKIAEYKQDFLLDDTVKGLRDFSEKHGLKYSSVATTARAHKWIEDKKILQAKALEKIVAHAPDAIAKKELDAVGRLTDFAEMLSGYQAMSFKRWYNELQKLNQQLSIINDEATREQVEKKIDKLEQKIDGSRMWRRVLEYLDRIIVAQGGVSDRIDVVNRLTYEQAKALDEALDAEFGKLE